MHHHTVSVVFFSEMIFFIMKSKHAFCQENHTSVKNHLITNATTTTTTKDCAEYSSDICTNVFEPEADDIQSNHSTVTGSTDSLEDIYNTLISAQDIFVIPIVCPIGIIGNSLVAHNLFSKRNTNSSFTYMVFILLADILSLVSDLFLPLSKILQSIPSAQTYEIAVNMYFWNADVFSYLFRRFSLNVFCVLSFERLIAILTPLKLYRSITVTHPYIFIVLSFIVSVLATIVTPLFTKMEMVYDKISNKTIFVHGLTDLYKENKESCSIIMIVARFLDGPIQILFFTIINGLIVRGLYENKKSVALASNKDRTKTISNLQTRLFKIFLILSFTNMLAFLPNAVVIIIAKLFPETGLNIKSTTLKIIVFGGNSIRVLNSLTDFIVFLAISKDIREEIYRKVRCKTVDDTKRCASYGIQKNINPV